jgi:hypothetical protein
MRKGDNYVVQFRRGGLIYDVGMITKDERGYYDYESRFNEVIGVADCRGYARSELIKNAKENFQELLNFYYFNDLKPLQIK